MDKRAKCEVAVYLPKVKHEDGAGTNAVATHEAIFHGLVMGELGRRVEAQGFLINDGLEVGLVGDVRFLDLSILSNVLVDLFLGPSQLVSVV
ncbi:hypothetical protein ACLOJK_038644 [Asimina triloba]